MYSIYVITLSARALRNFPALDGSKLPSVSMNFSIILWIVRGGNLNLEEISFGHLLFNHKSTISFRIL